MRAFISKIKRRLLSRSLQRVVEPVYIPTIEGNFLKGKVTMITGGTSGIGYAAALAFARCGCECVVITGRSQSRCDAVAEQISQATGNSRVVGIELDLNVPETIIPSFERVIEKTESGIDILLNNAGVYDGSRFPDVTLDTYNQVMDTNLRGPFILAQVVSADMIRRGTKGNICNVCSSSSYRPAVDPYMLSKWGMRGLTLGLAKRLIKHNIVVNGIAPGPTATPMLMKQENLNLAHNNNPSKRYASAEEIANLAVFLVSDMGRMIVGDIVSISGGAGIITYDDVNNY